MERRQRFALRVWPGLPGVQALDDDAPLVTVAESLGRTDCAGWALNSEPQPLRASINRAWVDREVHRDRMVSASDSFRPPAAPRYELATEGRSIVRWPELTIHISTDTPNRRRYLGPRPDWL